MRLPEEFCKSLGAQIYEALEKKRGTRREAAKISRDAIMAGRRKAREEALRRHETPANIHGVIWPIDPDTGADMTVLTTGDHNVHSGTC